MIDKKYTLHQDIETGRPFFSIIIPVYNAASYLRECIDSVRQQDFEDWEAILVDDCSTDSSTDIIEEFQKTDPRIKLSRSESNSGGACLPRLRAAKLSRGRYIVTIDADDTVDSDLLDSLHKAVTTDSIDLVIPEMWRFGRESSGKYLPLDFIDVDAVWRGRDLVEQTLVRWAIPMCGFAIRREIYLKAYTKVNPEEGKSIFADELLSRWLLFLSDKVRMCGSRYHYRYNSESVTNVNLPRIIQSRLTTADSLIAMTASAFGKDSSTYLRALENKLYKAVDLLRLITSSHLTAYGKLTCTRIVSSAMKGFDRRPLKGKTSPRYLALMRLPMPMARITLKIIDSIIKK